MKLIDWITGREPVATATGIAAVVTAGLGVAAAFGADITAEQIAAIGAFVAALAGWAARKAVSPVRHTVERRGEAGSVPLAAIIFFAVILAILAGIGVSCDALFEDENEAEDLGLPALVVDHRCYDCDDWDGGSDGNTGYDGEGGRSGDMEQDGDQNCRNFCFYGIPMPEPGR